MTPKTDYPPKVDILDESLTKNDLNTVPEAKIVENSKENKPEPKIPTYEEEESMIIKKGESFEDSLKKIQEERISNRVKADAGDQEALQKDAELLKKEQQITVENSINNNELKVAVTRKAYIDEYLKSKKEAHRQILIEKTKHVILNTLKKATFQGEKRTEFKEEEHLGEKFKENRKQYIEARDKLAESLYNKKSQELKEAGLSGDKLKEELTNYRLGEILNKTIEQESKKVQNARIEKSDNKTKEILKKAYTWYAKQPKAKRVLISTTLFLPVSLAGAHLVGGAVITGTGAAALYGINYSRSMLMGALIGKSKTGIDFLNKKKDADFVEKQKNERENAKKDYAEGKITLEQYEQKTNQLNYEERRKNRDRVIFTAGVGAGMSFLVGGLSARAGLTSASIFDHETHGNLHSLDLNKNIAKQDETNLNLSERKFDVKNPEIASSKDHTPIKDILGIKDTKPEATTIDIKDRWYKGFTKTDSTDITGKSPLSVNGTSAETINSNLSSESISINPDSGQGSIAGWAKLQHEVRIKFADQIKNHTEPETVKNFLNKSPTRLSEDFGQYKPDQINESFNISKDAKFSFDVKTGPSFHQDTKGEFFDSDHSGVKAQTGAEEHSTENASGDNAKLSENEITKTSGGPKLADNEIKTPTNPTNPEDVPAPEDNATTASASAKLAENETHLKLPNDGSTLTGSDMDKLMATKPIVGIPVPEHPLVTNYDGYDPNHPGAIAPRHDVYNTGDGPIYQRMPLRSINNAHTMDTNMGGNGFTKPVPMTDSAIYENHMMHRIPVRVANAPEQGGFDIKNNPENYKTGHDVEKHFKNKEIVIDKTEKDAEINGMTEKKWNDATDDMLKNRTRINSLNDYEKEKALQRLVGHGVETTALQNGENVPVIKMDYFRDMPEWKIVSKIPAKDFFDLKSLKDMESIKLTDGTTLSETDINALEKAGILEKADNDYYFTHSSELERMAKVYKDASAEAIEKSGVDLHNDQPMGDENVESYVERLTKHDRIAGDGSIFSKKIPVEKTQTLYSTGRINRPAVADNTPGNTNMNRPNANTTSSTNTVTDTDTANTQTTSNPVIQKIFPDDEQVQGMTRSEYDGYVEKILINDGKIWPTLADKEADMWIWEKFGKISNGQYLSPDENQNFAFIKEKGLSARDLMTTGSDIRTELLSLQEKVRNYTGANINPESNESMTNYVRRLMSKITNGQ